MGGRGVGAWICRLGLGACCISIGACGGAEPFEPLPVAPKPPMVSVSLSEDESVSDPERGRQRFETSPGPQLLACYDCHSEDPVNKNFGNIWVGKNAPSLIARAINLNTGGMGYFSSYLKANDIADIAAYLGISPARLTWTQQAVNASSLSAVSYEAKTITIYAGTKSSVEALKFSISENFKLVASDCTPTLDRFGKCQLSITPRTDVVANRSEGELLISYLEAPRPVRVRLILQAAS